MPVKSIAALLGLLGLLAAARAPGAGLSHAVIPVHGVVLDPDHKGLAIVRNDPVTGMLPSEIRGYRIVPHLKLAAGVGIDGFLDRSASPPVWYDAAVAGKFDPGQPDPGDVSPIDYGSLVPNAPLVDQRGRIVRLDGFKGKVTLLSFVFTRCKDSDECPLVSSKYSFLQRKLDPKHFHLVEITLDPTYDSPWVLRDYAAKYGANPQAWSILTGQPKTIQNLLDRFGISSLQTSSDDFVHNDRLFVIDGKSRVADIIDTTGWDPGNVIAEARHVAGLTSSPLGRLELSLVADVVALCGGSQYAGVVLMETVLVFLIAAICISYLTWFAKKIWGRSA
ncbi:MAG: SCO family protein [Vulcanimicrobiaceae bacterium]